MAKATKSVIAAVLATTAVVPAIAVSANEATTTSVQVTTEQVANTIDFTLQEPTGRLGTYVTGPATLVERNGAQYMQLNLSDAVLEMVEQVLVGKISVLEMNNGKKTVLIRLTEDYAPINVDFTLNSPFVSGNFEAVITPVAPTVDAPEPPTEETPEQPEEKPTQPTPEKPAEEQKPVFEEGDFGEVENGVYDITYDAINPNDNTVGYTAITSHFKPAAKLIVEDGAYRVQIETAERSNAMIADVTIAGKSATVISGTATAGTRVFEASIPSLEALHDASVHVVVAAMGMDKVYPFGFAVTAVNEQLVEAPTPEQPVTPEEPIEETPAPPTTETPAPTTPPSDATTMPLYVYTDGEQKLSIMQGTYVNEQVEVTSTATGYNVDITFPKGQHINSFDVLGATVAKKSETVEGENTVKVYTVQVDDLTRVYTATVDLSVRHNENGVEFAYDEIYDVQMQFGGKVNPFTDIQRSANYGAIVQLYSAGIFKESNKFNPNDNVKRSQFALMLQRGLQLDVPATTKFTDIAKFDAEAQNAIKALNGYGVINGTTGTTFAPGMEITRKQAALMIYRLLVKKGFEPTGVTADFTDVKGNGEDAVAIAELNKLGVMTGFEGKFNPQNKLTRNQMAKVLHNTLQVIETLK
ncbi:S-layer homology domain-containing protein [Caryophanon latum]|uniref:NEAT domain-containing protein n=1 Tax=Caryophanon latum TaxID=33977 RepID=A0A1C0YB36_9BACL|nr:S-layer homology domain-containing protein [Caryophanon latum]OCS84349.1 hypothetical protein A6K76_15700 [Caryophanon latum]